MVPMHIQLETSVLHKVIKRLHFPLEIMLVCVRWYAAYALSLRNLEEMMAERGVAVDHASVHRRAVKILPLLAQVFRGRKRPVGGSWRMDETYIEIGGQWMRQSRYLNNQIEQDHRAVKRRTRPMPGFKDFHCAARIIAGIEVMHMIRKDRWAGPEGQVMSAAELFYSLAY